MQLALLVFGVILIATALQGTVKAFFTQLADDLTGTGGFLIWVGVLTAIWVGGNITGLERPARALIVLMIVVYAFKNSTAFGKVAEAFQSARPQQAANPIGQGQPTQVSGPTATPTTGTGAGADAGGGAASGSSSPGAAPASQGGIMGAISGALSSVFGAKK